MIERKGQSEFFRAVERKFVCLSARWKKKRCSGIHGQRQKHLEMASQQADRMELLGKDNFETWKANAGYVRC